MKKCPDVVRTVMDLYGWFSLELQPMNNLQLETDLRESKAGKLTWVFQSRTVISQEGFWTSIGSENIKNVIFEEAAALQY